MIFALLLLNLMLAGLLTGAVEQTAIRAVQGDDCVLSCVNVSKTKLSVVVWSRVNGSQTSRLLVLRGGRVQEGYEHPKYTNRTSLTNPNVCLVLKKVTLEDSGEYQCQTVKEDGQMISEFIRLTVTKKDLDTANPDLNLRQNRGLIFGLMTGLMFGLIFVLTAVIFILKRKKRNCDERKMKNSCCEAPVEVKTPLEKNHKSPLQSSNIIRSDSDCSDLSASSGESATSTTGLIPSTNKTDLPRTGLAL